MRSFHGSPRWYRSPARFVLVLFAVSVDRAEAGAVRAASRFARPSWSLRGCFPRWCSRWLRFQTRAARASCRSASHGPQVEQAWRGSLSGIVEVSTGSGGDRGYDLVVGTRYLIYAHGRDGRLVADTCSRTETADRGGGGSHASAAFQPSAVGRSWLGQISATEAGKSWSAATGLPHFVARPDREWKATTDATAATISVPAGRSIQLPCDLPNTRTARATWTLQFRRLRTGEFTVVPEGRIVTRVIDADGKPMQASGRVREGGHAHAESDLSRGEDGDVGCRRARRGAAASARPVVDRDRRQVSHRIETAYPRLFYPGVADSAVSSTWSTCSREEQDRSSSRSVSSLHLCQSGGYGASSNGQTVPPPRARMSRCARNGVGAGLACTVGTPVPGADKDGRFTVRRSAGRRYRLSAFIDVKNERRETHSVDDGFSRLRAPMPWRGR